MIMYDFYKFLSNVFLAYGYILLTPLGQILLGLMTGNSEFQFSLLGLSFSLLSAMVGVMFITLSLLIRKNLDTIVKSHN